MKSPLDARALLGLLVIATTVVATGIFLSRAFIIICRLILAGVFIYAAIGKILDPEHFAELVNGYRILPIPVVNLAAIILPWMELLCGLSLLSGILVRSSGLLLAGVNAIFFVAVASAMARGLDIECGCFTLSKAHSKVGWIHLVLDLVLIALCLPIIFAPKRNKKSPSPYKSALTRSQHQKVKAELV